MATRRQVTLPTVEPIVPVIRDRPFDDPAYLFEPKYDGFRGLLYLSGRECHFRSKRGNVLKQFEELCYWVKDELRVREVILDGEVVALDPEGRQDFRALLEVARDGELSDINLAPSLRLDAVSSNRRLAGCRIAARARRPGERRARQPRRD